MRRTGLLLLAVVTSLALVAPPAAAEGHRGHGRPPIARTGTFAGTGTYEIGTVCPFAWEVINGTLDDSWRPGDDGTFTLDYCASIEDFSFAGTFTVETASGITLSVSSVDTSSSGSPGACRRNASTSAVRSRPMTIAARSLAT